MPPYLANLNAGTANYNQATQPPLLFPPYSAPRARRRSTSFVSAFPPQRPSRTRLAPRPSAPKTLRLQDALIDSGTGAVARFLDKLHPGLVRSHALHPSSVDPEHPFGTAIGGSLVPPISRSSWPYVEAVYCEVLTAYLGTSPLPDVVGAGEPALAPHITACLALCGASSYSGVSVAVNSAPIRALAELRALVPGAAHPPRPSSAP